MKGHTISHNGQTLTIKEWAAKTNQSPSTLRGRLNAGWPIELALYHPLHKRGRKRVTEADTYRAESIEREFMLLVADIDGALRAFRAKLNHLLNDAPGVGQNPQEIVRDRCPRVAQESV